MNVHALCNVEHFCAVGHMPALQEHSAVGWMTKEVSGREKFPLIYKASEQTLEASPATHSVCTQGKQPDQEAYHLPLSSARFKNMWNCVCCTFTPLYTLTVWCLMKHGDIFTLYGVCSC
jgi:hypothetical protein